MQTPEEDRVEGLKHRDSLIQGIADGLHELVTRTKGRCQIGSIEVRFLEGEGIVWTGGLDAALESISNNLWWNEESDWSNADSVEVRTI